MREAINEGQEGSAVKTNPFADRSGNPRTFLLLLNCADVKGGGVFEKKLVTAAAWYDGMGKILLKPPPLKITCSQALSGSFTVAPGFTCVAPTAVMKGQVTGKPGLNLFPFSVALPAKMIQLTLSF